MMHANDTMSDERRVFWFYEEMIHGLHPRLMGLLDFGVLVMYYFVFTSARD